MDKYISNDKQHIIDAVMMFKGDFYKQLGIDCPPKEAKREGYCFIAEDHSTATWATREDFESVFKLDIEGGKI